MNAPTAQPPLNPPVRPPVMRPGVRFLFSHPAHLIALGFGSGLSPVAPGTAGTLFGWASFYALQAWLTPAQIGLAIVAAFFLGWWACKVAADHMRVLDPGSIVWDEVIAIWIILWLVMPAGWVMQLAAFVLFRFFDAVKPGPVGWADALYKGYGWRGGIGILLDDLVAAVCTLLVLAFWIRL